MRDWITWVSGWFVRICDPLLEWPVRAPDQFLNLDGDLIQCATHDALFRIEDGVCIADPSSGRSLTRLRVEVCNDDVVVLLD